MFFIEQRVVFHAVRQRDERILPARRIEHHADEIEEGQLLPLRGLEIGERHRVQLVVVQVAVVEEQARRQARRLRIELRHAAVNARVHGAQFLLDLLGQEPGELAVLRHTAGDHPDAAQIVEPQVVVAQLRRAAASLQQMLEEAVLLIEHGRQPALSKAGDLRRQALDERRFLERARALEAEVVTDIVELRLRHLRERRPERALLRQLPAVEALVPLLHIRLRHLLQVAASQALLLFPCHICCIHPFFPSGHARTQRATRASQPKKSAMPSAMPCAAFCTPSSLFMSFSSVGLEMNATSTSVAGISVCFTT